MSAAPRFWFGGDYNPEQWPESVWTDDIRLMREGGITMATVAVFGWARIEPREGEFDFTMLDRVMDTLHDGGVRVDLATATASPPAWLGLRYPETLPTTADGTILRHGSRQAYCPSSPVYRDRARRLVRAIAERYGEHPALELWHVNNEYGCHVTECFCETSAGAFREWLGSRYGTIKSLNDAWGTEFWSQRYDSFDEVQPPRLTPTFHNPTHLLDFARFSSDELLECYRSEAAILRDVSPGVPLTTNFLGFLKGVNYWQWAGEVDVVSNDAYPDPADPASWEHSAMTADLMRSLGGGEPWMLMEQAASAVQWRSRNAAKAPGQMRSTSFQAVARGADAIMFFQWRQSRVGAEKFHSGMVPHSGTDTRVWREVTALGNELALLANHGVLGSRVESRVAIVLDWESWWAVEQPATPTRVSYIDNVRAWHAAVGDHGLAVDFLNPDFERPESKLDDYAVVIVPMMSVATDGQLQRLDEYVRRGGNLVATYLTGIMDERLHVRTGGYLGPLAETLGIWIEEFTPPAAANGGEPRPLALAGAVVADGDGVTWSETVRVIDAEVLATFTATGSAAVTRRRHHAGIAWYVATQPVGRALFGIVSAVVADAELTDRDSHGLEIVERGGLNFVMNHTTEPQELSIDGVDVLSGYLTQGMRLDPFGVAVVLSE